MTVTLVLPPTDRDAAPKPNKLGRKPVPEPEPMLMVVGGTLAATATTTDALLVPTVLVTVMLRVVLSPAVLSVATA